VGTKSFSLSCEDAQDKDAWLEIRNQGSNWLTQADLENGHQNGVCVCVTLYVIQKYPSSVPTTAHKSFIATEWASNMTPEKIFRKGVWPGHVTP